MSCWLGVTAEQWQRVRCGAGRRVLWNGMGGGRDGAAELWSVGGSLCQ